MRQLNFELKALALKYRENSHSTQGTRFGRLQSLANQLHNLGFRQMGARSLKPKHVDALVKSWFEKGNAVGTMKNDMIALRWWAEKVGLKGVVAASNSFYGIPDRELVTNKSKAVMAPETALQRISDPYVRASVELQATFGLRREECMKFIPSYADKGDHIVLKSSWTKGGKPRVVPVRTAEQRAALDRARAVAGSGSLIPAHLQYAEHLKTYTGQVAAAGLSKLHGLRHAYAQERYLELTGRLAPAAGGKTSKELTPEEKAIDREVRLLISKELGHEREQITAIYLGR